MNGPTGRSTMGPTELLAHVDRVRERYELGILDGDDTASALGRVHLIDEDGSAWAVGVRSRSWYRFRDGRWVAAGRAPDPARLLSAGELLGICASCGSESGGGRFCGSCGVEQVPGRLGADAQPALASFLEHGYDTLPEPLPERALPPEPASAAQAVVPASQLAGAPAPSSTPPTAPIASTARARESRGSHARRLGSVISTVIGAGLLVLSGSRLVLGLTGTAVAPPDGSPVPTFVGPAQSAAASGPAAASSEPAASILLAETMPPSIAPAGRSIHFADGFDSEGPWPTGDDGFLGASYDAGRLVIDVHPADLPVYRWAVNESMVGQALTVEASMAFETAGPMAFGLAVADADRLNKLVVLVEPDGQWAIDRDNVEAFDTLLGGRMTGSVDPTVVHRLRLELDGEGAFTAWLDETKLGAVSADLDVAQFGIAAWSVEDGGRFAVDDYLVTVP